MKVSKLIIPLLGLTNISNANNQISQEKVIQLEKEINPAFYEVMSEVNWNNYSTNDILNNKKAGESLVQEIQDKMVLYSNTHKNEVGKAETNSYFTGRVRTSPSSFIGCLCTFEFHVRILCCGRLCYLCRVSGGQQLRIMLKISFWLKKSDTDQGSLEYITISNPQKVLEGKFTGMYLCETYQSEREKMFPIYASNPIDAIFYASSSVRINLQNYVIKHGYKISEKENGEAWKEAWRLEIGEPQLIMQERIKKIKEAQDIPPEIKQKILESLKESFGKIPHMKDKLNNI